LQLTERDIYKYFGDTYASRGDTYERSGRVKSCRFDHNTLLLHGQVVGSDRQPYQVQMRLVATGLKIETAICSCPMGGYCKHSAALALHALRTGEISESNAALAPSVKPAPQAQAAKLSARSASWISDLAKAFNTQPATAKTTPIDSVLYVLDVSRLNVLMLKPVHARRLKSGAWGSAQSCDLDRLAASTAQYVTAEDCEIAKIFLAAQKDKWSYEKTFSDIPELSQHLVKRIIATGRCFWKSKDSIALTTGPAKQAGLKWKVLPNANQVLQVYSEDADDIAVIAGSAWYINPVMHQLGPLDLSLPLGAVKSILSAPAIEAQEAMLVTEALNAIGASVPKPEANFSIETITASPRPTIKLLTKEFVMEGYRNRREVFTESTVLLTFDYGGLEFDPPKMQECRTIDGNKILIHKRDLATEEACLEQIENIGLLDIGDTIHDGVALTFPDDEPQEWIDFVSKVLPLLKSQGWQIEFDKSFAYNIVVPDDEWTIEATQSSDFWFSLDLGITVDGERVPLLPIIHRALRQVTGSEPLIEIEQLNHDGIFYAPLQDGRIISLPFDRVKGIVSALLELFDGRSDVPENAEVTIAQIINLQRAMAENIGQNELWLVGDKLAALVDKIKNFAGIDNVQPPPSFSAELRPYQLEGLAWLNFLREFGLGGILADDMGLGKTVQTLAHIALEKAENRLDKPFLVICPTSVLPNWLSEIDKFVPQLKVTALIGPNRAENHFRIASSDIVVSTYPLVVRDEKTLVKQKWKAVILDEAQAIKNPGTLISKTVGKLHSDYKICLTGTPIENHLGELWAQFNFLMPGFLKDLPTFNKSFRWPIERQKNKFLQKLLATKVRPFLLRRTKELVAKELPAKTIIIKNVDLDGEQRDLYETVRLSMYEKVKDALASKGLAKSQIIILDAMLKLRQVCCDPRLVPLAAAKNMQSTVKLDLLLEMLEELIDEGKSILLFSQFTSMLDLIIPELESRKIAFAQIRGSTKDRATPVKDFQSGSVKLFLLSLKAGGTGLNLTAADTVIHYDPWWNPAVENQATDRAHRIGQKKAVFVFKLIASGTIEERLLELQERKRAIADGIFDEDNALPSKLTAADIESLFTPLPTGKRRERKLITKQ